MQDSTTLEVIMDQVHLNWVESITYDGMVIAKWGRTTLRIWEDAEHVTRLDIFGEIPEDWRTPKNPMAKPCGGIKSAKREAAEWIAKAFGQCQNRSFVNEWRCGELATRVNDMGTRYCVGCNEHYEDEMRSRKRTITA